MKERPILMHARSVNGILAGRKTQTRRIISKQPPAGYDRHAWFDAPVYGWTYQDFPAEEWFTVKCPYGVVGDRLWVREEWKARAVFDGLKPVDIGQRVGKDILYLADGTIANISGVRESFVPGRYRQARYMPHWVSRLTLEITGIRVERLQDITEQDAKAEESYLNKCECFPKPRTPIESMMKQTWCHQHGSEFKTLWDDTNGKSAWDRNDWVWVVDFRRLP